MKMNNFRSILTFAIAFGLVVMPTTATAPSFTTIDVPGAIFSDAFGISAQGDIVGQFGDGTGQHGFLLRQGSFTTIDVPGATGTSAAGINPQGDIVGVYAAGGTFDRGFLLERGTFTTIDVPGATGTIAVGINSRGDIAGIFSDS